MKVHIDNVVGGFWLGVGFGAADLLFTLITKALDVYDYFYK